MSGNTILLSNIRQINIKTLINENIRSNKEFKDF